MDKKTIGLSGAFKENTAPKRFVKNPINGTKYTIGIIHWQNVCHWNVRLELIVSLVSSKQLG